MSRHEVNPAGGTRLMSTTTRALKKAGHTLWTANLDNCFDGPEVDAEIKTGSTNYGLELGLMQLFLDPVSQFLADGSMVHGDHARQFRRLVKHFLIPDFRK